MEAHTDLQPLCVLRVFSVSKTEARNEDHVFVSDDKLTCAVSDGASVSFDSGPWAKILSRRFVQNPEISREWLTAAIAEYSSAYDRDSMSWSYQAAFDRGSFATLLGVVCSSDGRGIRTFAFGDTLLAFIEGGKLLRTIPYLQPEEFDSSPKLISTNPLENRAFDDAAISEAWHVLTTASHEAPTILLMTDAIGRWLLEQPDSDRVRKLAGNYEPEEFASFIESERAEGRMKRDDSTLIVVGQKT